MLLFSSFSDDSSLVIPKFLHQVDYSKAQTLVLNNNNQEEEININKSHSSSYPRIEIVWGPDGEARGVKLSNGKLSVWLNLIPVLEESAPEESENKRNFYAGSATSVLIGNREMLDFFRSEEEGVLFPPSKPYWMNHDLEKRCMQLDKIQLWDKIHEKWSDSYQLFDKTYEIISHSIDPRGVSIKMASSPFGFSDSDNKSQYRLYRIITLRKDTNYVEEDLYVSKVELSANKPQPTSDIMGKEQLTQFKAHYFTFIDLHFCPELVMHRLNQGFAMVSLQHPHPYYVFMSNVGLDHHEHPTTDYPDKSKDDNTFSWVLSGGQYAKCLHGFSCFQQFKLEDLPWPSLSC